MSDTYPFTNIASFAEAKLPYFSHMDDIFESHRDIYDIYLTSPESQNMEFHEYISIHLKALEDKCQTAFDKVEEIFQEKKRLIDMTDNNEAAMMNILIERSRNAMIVTHLFALLRENYVILGEAALENPADEYDRIVDEEIESFCQAYDEFLPGTPLEDILHEFLGTILANTRLRMYTISPLIVKFDKKQIKNATRFEYDDIVEMAMRIGIKEKYSYVATTCDGSTTATYEVNMDPVWQMYILLCRYAHADSLDMLGDYVGISPSLLSIVERGVEKQIYLMNGDNLIPSNCRIPYDYLTFLRDTSPTPENPETNLIKPNTCLFVDGSHLRISCPTGSIEGDYIHSEKDKICCFRHQSLCDSNGLILGLFGPAEYRIPDKRLFDKSGLAHGLSQFRVDGEYLQCFGEASYIGVTTPTDQLTCSFKPLQNTTLTPEQKLFNEQHSKIRVVVEQCFSNVSHFWRGVSEKFSNRMLVSDLAIKTAVSMFIVNCHLICYRGCTNQKLFETHDNGKTYQSTRMIDLEVYINQWIKPEIYLDNIHFLEERLMQEVHDKTISFDNF